MYSIITACLFYVFAAITVGAAISVITIRNPIYSVLSLILAFFGTAGLFVLIGAEFIAMTLIIVYVGAVAVLFLFVVMMLNINWATITQGFTKFLPVSIALACVLFMDLVLVLTSSLNKSGAAQAIKTDIPANIPNTHAIGSVLYTDYILAFQIAGVILFAAMISCIVLTLRVRTGVRKQKFQEQIARSREESVTLVKVKSGEGINGIIN